jgi:hypothetical protein
MDRENIGSCLSLREEHIEAANESVPMGLAGVEESIQGFNRFHAIMLANINGQYEDTFIWNTQKYLQDKEARSKLEAQCSAHVGILHSLRDRMATMVTNSAKRNHRGSINDPQQTSMSLAGRKRPRVCTEQLIGTSFYLFATVTLKM